MRGRFVIWAAVCLLADAALLLGLQASIRIPARGSERGSGTPPAPPEPAAQARPGRLSAVALEVRRTWPWPAVELALLPQFRTRLRVNESSAPALAAIPGLGGRAALALAQYRRRHGPFRHRAELLDVPGIGWATYLKLLDFVTLDRVLALGAHEPES
jgi:competence ComEA-like helix-hairpin-helix protein